MNWQFSCKFTHAVLALRKLSWMVGFLCLKSFIDGKLSTQKSFNKFPLLEWKYCHTDHRWSDSENRSELQILNSALGKWKEYFDSFFFPLTQTSALPEWRSNMGVSCLLIHFMAFLAASLSLFLLCIVLAFWQEAYFTAYNKQSVDCHYKFMKPEYFWIYAAS